MDNNIALPVEKECIHQMVNALTVVLLVYSLIKAPTFVSPALPHVPVAMGYIQQTVSAAVIHHSFLTVVIVSILVLSLIMLIMVSVSIAMSVLQQVDAGFAQVLVSAINASLITQVLLLASMSM